MASLSMGATAPTGFRLDLPPEEAAKLRARARLQARRQANEARYALDPWAFLCEAVWTLDQRGGTGAGIRPYPGGLLDDGRCTPPVIGVCALGGCSSALQHLVRRWHVGTRIGLIKSRRLLATWTMVAAHYWLARYRPASLIALAARKQGQTEDEGSAELVKRVKFIHDHLPKDVLPRPIRYGFARFAFTDNDSVIMGIAQGADQARQYTYTAYLADEFAFWEQAAATYSALLPTLEGGGKFTFCTTAAPGFAEQLTFDRWHTGE